MCNCSAKPETAAECCTPLPGSLEELLKKLRTEKEIDDLADRLVREYFERVRLG